jgi:hypothetical protein
MLDKNLQALSIKNQHLAQKIYAHTFEDIEFAKTETGEYNIFYRGIPIHSEQNPQEEAKEVFGEEDKNENGLCCLFGLGLGYLFKRAYLSFAGTIIVYEPIIDILRATLEVVDFSQELSDSRVFIIQDYKELEGIFYKYRFESARLINLNSYRIMLPELYEQTFYELNKLYIDQNTNIQKSIEIAEGFVANLPSIVKTPSVEVLEGLFKNYAALVVSAGPSLDKAIETIKENRKKFVIIAIGQAVKALYAADIMPDLVVLIDMLPFDHQIECLGEEKRKLNLVLEPSTHNNLYIEPVKSRFVYLPDSDYMSMWYAKRCGAKGYPQAGTVSIIAFHLAKITGANPIILVGQDLAYSGGKAYASNTIYDAVKLQIDEKQNVKARIELENNSEILTVKDEILLKNKNLYENTLLVKGQSGEMLPTINSYATFITIYNDLAKYARLENNELEIINASTGGAYLQNFDHKTLEDAVNSLEDLDRSPIELINNIYSEYKPDYESIRSVSDDFQDLLTMLQRLKTETLSVLKISSRIKKELKLSKNITNKAMDMARSLQKLDMQVRSYNTDNKISFIYPFIQKELFEYNKIKDRIVLSEYDKFVLAVEIVEAFSNAMRIGAERTINSFKKLSNFPVKE